MKNKCILFFLLCIAIFITACEVFDEDRILSPFSQYWKIPPEYDDSGATKSLHVAAVSFKVDISPEINRNKITYYIEKIMAEQPSVRLILFPEATLGYYYMTSNPLEYQKSVAETIPGETTDMLSQKAIYHQIYISFGMAEKSGEKLFNSQVMIAPDGTISSVYRKYYLISLDNENGFTAGNDITIDVIDNIKVATIICNDMNNLTLQKKIHKSGAELVLVSIAGDSSALSENTPILNPIFTWLLGANRVGYEQGIDYDGYIYLYSPSGEKKARSIGKEGYIHGVVKCY